MVVVQESAHSLLAAAGPYLCDEEIGRDYRSLVRLQALALELRLQDTILRAGI